RITCSATSICAASTGSNAVRRMPSGVSSAYSSSPLPRRRRASSSLGRMTPAELPMAVILSFMAWASVVITNVTTWPQGWDGIPRPGGRGINKLGHHRSGRDRPHRYNPRMHLPDYPFTPQRLQVRPGIEMRYLDEGPRDGEVVVALHGNPSWSYYWRHLVLGLRDRYRVIVPDHVGMGLSDKPDDHARALPRYDYTLQSRVDDVAALLDHLGIDGPMTLAVHDWGGMIGFGWALSHAAQVKRLVITNTAAFPMPADK